MFQIIESLLKQAAGMRRKAEELENKAQELIDKIEKEIK